MVSCRQEVIAMVAKCDVVVVMGSRSNLKVMTQATNLLKKLGIPCEVRVVSAHRTPRKAHKYIASVEGARARVYL